MTTQLDWIAIEHWMRTAVKARKLGEPEAILRMKSKEFTEFAVGDTGRGLLYIAMMEGHPHPDWVRYTSMLRAAFKELGLPLGPWNKCVLGGSHE